MSERFLYWAAFLIYSLVVVGIGGYVWFKEKKSGKVCDNSAYWEARRDLSSWSVGLSISASMMSISWSCVYGVQLFYWYGPGGAWLLIIPWLLTMLGFFFFAPLFRKFKVFSQPQLLERRFGKEARSLLAPALILVFITWTGAEIYAAGQIIAPFLGISLPATLLIITVVVAVYSYTGGFEAVVSTDKIQFLLVAFFITVIAYLAWSALPADIHLLKDVQPPKAQHSSPWLSPGWALILMTFMAYLPGWIVETDVWIRLQAAKSNPHARGGILLAGFNSLVFVGVMPFVIGLSALVLYPATNGQIPVELQDGALIFTVIMKQYAPVWLNLLLSVGLIAAAMSTIDTCGNVVALSFSHDLLEPGPGKNWSAKKLNRVARWSSVGAIFISFIYALFTESLWDIFYLSSGILTTTVFIPVVSSFFKSTTARQVQWAMALGFVGTLFFYFLESRGYSAAIEPAAVAETGLGYILWGFGLSVLGFFLGKLKAGSVGQSAS